MMEAVSTSETLVNFYQTTRLYNPEDSQLRTHRRENLKSYILRQNHLVENLGFARFKLICECFYVRLIFNIGACLNFQA
jgi:hypothetical protein